MTMRRAADARFLINTFLVAVQEWDADTEHNECDVSNTEGLLGNPNVFNAAGLSGTVDNCRSFISDIGRVRGMIRNATWDEVNNIFLPPLVVLSGQYFILSYFPSGITGPQYGPWNCLCIRANHKGVVGQGTQPLTIYFTTDGESLLHCR